MTDDTEIEAHLAAETRKLNGRLRDVKGDPARTVEDHAHDRVRKLIDDLKGGGIVQLSELRDTLDDLMRAINAKSDAVEASVAELAGFVQAAITMATVVRGPIEEQAKAIRSGVQPAPGKTITQQRQP